MKTLSQKRVVIPIREELQKVMRLVSDKERMTNSRLKKHTEKLYLRAYQFLEAILGPQLREVAKLQ